MKPPGMKTANISRAIGHISSHYSRQNAPMCRDGEGNNLKPALAIRRCSRLKVGETGPDRMETANHNGYAKQRNHRARIASSR